MTVYEDIRYERIGSAAVVTIDRPKRYNAFRGRTIEELIAAFRVAWADHGVRAVVLTGVLCDLTIAAESARFGQAGPRVGSFDAGFGSTYLARVIGAKRAREVWYLCRQYDAVTAERWGLVNAVVPAAEVLAEALRWAEEIAVMSPTAIRFLKHSFNADTEHQAGLANMATAALEMFVDSPEGEMFVDSPEGQEGARAFTEKRAPDFAAHAG
ncbi:enoyl-CoA hydratase-related protein [Pseudonocardia sp. GCM10023141]|uniref:enoyl-CoA hydratase-related protein n=1 Tax=Pseudonocardia sp. GCM10023141 TaxID=3252653 RepID=UPI0036197535